MIDPVTSTQWPLYFSRSGPCSWTVTCVVVSVRKNSPFLASSTPVPVKAVAAGSTVPVDVTVTNTGQRAGDEIAQLYLEFPNVPGAPLRALRAFQRVHLEAGASQKLHFELQPRDLSMVTDAGVPIIAQGEYQLSVGGGQPNTGAPVITQPLNIEGKLVLPE